METTGDFRLIALMKLMLAHPFEASTSMISILPLDGVQPEYSPAGRLESCVVKFPWVKSALVGGVQLFKY